MPPITVTGFDTKDHNNVTVDHDEHANIHVLLSTEKRIEMQNDDTFCRDIVQLIKKKLLSVQRMF